MVTEIGEKIKVEAIFSDGHLKPLVFFWNKRRYVVKKVFGAYHDFLGRARRLHYAVGCGSEDIFEITLNTEKMEWELDRVHIPD